MGETWKPVVGYETAYEVSDTGRVRGIDRIVNHPIHGPTRRKGRLLKLVPGGKGYLTAHLSINGKASTKKVACLVAASFIGPRPEGMQVCHGDGDKKNDALRNLRYDTQSGNCADKRIHGTSYCGEKNHLAKLNAQSVMQIRGGCASISSCELAVLFGVSETTIQRARSGQTWAHL